MGPSRRYRYRYRYRWPCPISGTLPCTEYERRSARRDAITRSWGTQLAAACGGVRQCVTSTYAEIEDDAGETAEAGMEFVADPTDEQAEEIERGLGERPATPVRAVFVESGRVVAGLDGAVHHCVDDGGYCSRQPVEHGGPHGAEAATGWRCRERTAVGCDGPGAAQRRVHAPEIAEPRARRRPPEPGSPRTGEHHPGEWRPAHMAATIPMVDVDGADLASARKSEIARAIDDAFRSTGFCYVTNTGMDAGLTEAVFDASRRFHALGDDAKQEIAINAFHRGYIAPKSSLIRASSVARVTRPNLSESFMAMHEVAPDDSAFGKPLQGPNQWPGGLPGFREAVTAYQGAMTDFARRFTRLLAIALGLPETSLDSHFERPTSWLRLIRYPPEPSGTPADQYGAAPHTDYGFITFLVQDEHDGLEVRVRGRRVDFRAADSGIVRGQRGRHARALEQRSLVLHPAPGPEPLRERPLLGAVLLGHGHGERD